jgi:hypothetical protein
VAVANLGLEVRAWSVRIKPNRCQVGRPQSILLPFHQHPPDPPSSILVLDFVTCFNASCLRARPVQSGSRAIMLSKGVIPTGHPRDFMAQRRTAKTCSGKQSLRTCYLNNLRMYYLYIPTLSTAVTVAIPQCPIQKTIPTTTCAGTSQAIYSEPTAPSCIRLQARAALQPFHVCTVLPNVPSNLMLFANRPCPKQRHRRLRRLKQTQVTTLQSSKFILKLPFFKPSNIFKSQD